MKGLILGLLFLINTCFAQSVSETFSVKQEPDGTSVFTNYTISTDNGLREYNYNVLKGDSVSQFLSEKLLKKYFNKEDQYNIQYDLKGYYIIAGYTNNGGLTGNPQDNNYWLIKLVPFIYNKTQNSSAVLFPNPATSQTTLLVSNHFLKKFSLFLYDLSGRQLKVFPIKNIKTDMDLKDLAPGTYIYIIKGLKSMGPVGKLIIQ